MRVLLAAAATLLFAGSAAAQNCERFVHESDPNTWIVQTDKGFEWHKEGEVFTYDIGRYSSEDDPRLIASSGGVPDAEMGDEDFVQYRFAEVNDRDALLWDGWFYFRDCAAVSRK